MNFPSLFRRRKRRDQELDDEIRAHLAMAVRERIERGEDPADAEINARREFGNSTLVKEVTRDMWGWRWLETLLQDLRYGLRQLRRNPGFTAVAVITFALGIGANTAMFSVIDAVLLHPLPYRDPSRLAFVYSYLLRDGVWADIRATPADFLDWRAEANVFQDMATSEMASFDVAGGSTPIHITGVRATQIYFRFWESILSWDERLARQMRRRGRETWRYWDMASGETHLVHGATCWAKASGSMDGPSQLWV
jgi:hypothetical protein